MPNTPENLKTVMQELEDFYEELDRLVQNLAAAHAGRLHCRCGCMECCVDGITVFEVEAENIRRHHGELLATGAPRQPGACAFLDPAGACRIYENRPYVCRTQGLPLRWIDETPEGDPVEMRDICPVNDGAPPVESLPEEECWTLGPFEERLATLQARLGGWELRRVPLRDLWRDEP